MPFLPRLTGYLTADAHFIQTATSFQLSTEIDIKKLTYEQQPIGDIGIGATWLPGDKYTHYLNAYFSSNEKNVLNIDGTLKQKDGKDSITVTTDFEHFPLILVNAFIPDQMVTLGGDIDGSILISGYTDKPIMNGNLALDSVSVFAQQANARYWFDNRPLEIRNNQLLFNKFAIYTTSKNPFTIDGKVDFQDLTRPIASLNLLAQNYTLLDAPKTKESLIYGKIFVDLKATVKGPLDALNMRGNMTLLGNTDVTYVLTDSPLTVSDRLGDLVTFVNFNDTVPLDQAAP